VLGYREDWDSEYPNNEETAEPWGTFDNSLIYECLMAMYKDNLEVGVRSVTQEEYNNEVFPEESNEEDENDEN
jgi:hypothetical protein